jgi:hypothetical protein
VTSASTSSAITSLTKLAGLDVTGRGGSPDAPNTDEAFGPWLPRGASGSAIFPLARVSRRAAGRNLG